MWFWLNFFAVSEKSDETYIKKGGKLWSICREQEGKKSDTMLCKTSKPRHEKNHQFLSNYFFAAYPTKFYRFRITDGAVTVVTTMAPAPTGVGMAPCRGRPPAGVRGGTAPGRRCGARRGQPPDTTH